MKPVQYAEQALVTAILEGKYPAGTNLPAERELAAQLGVTRPTLRETIRRLQGDGWLTVQQGKPTRVNDFWREGGLNVLSALVRYSQELPDNFVLNLLQVRRAMAPAYARLAVECNWREVAAFLARYESLPDTPEDYAAFDWRMHYVLTLASGNPIYTLILNGFAGFYEQMARVYFSWPGARLSSREFYARLLSAAQEGSQDKAEAATREMMDRSIQLWERVRREFIGGAHA